MADFELLAPGGHQKLVDEVEDRLDLKADIDGYYAQLTAGAALGITGEATDSAAWLQRVSTSDGPTTVKSIHGRTVRWNQLLGTWTGSASGIAFSGSDGKETASGTPNTTGNTRAVSAEVTIGHKYLVNASGATYGSGNTAAIHCYHNYLYINGGIVDTSSWAASDRIGIGVSYTSGETVSLSFYPQLFDLTAMFGSGNEPSTVAEFEALYPEPYYEYDAGSLLSVQMEGIETVGFNQWDEQMEEGVYNSTDGTKTSSSAYLRSTNMIPVFPSAQYYCKRPSGSTFYCYAYDADGNFISNSGLSVAANWTFTIPAGVHYFTFAVTKAQYGTTYNNDICINLSDPTRNGTYEPYWSQERTIPAGTLRGAGTVYDELTETERITRVGEVDLGTLTWVYDTSNARFNTSGALPDAATTSERVDVPCSKYVFAPTGSVDKSIFMYNGAIYVYDSAYTDAATFKTAMSGVMAHYALAEPTTVEIDPPLNITYRTAQGGTETVLVPTGELSAPPTLVTAQGYTAESLRDAALATIAPVENGTASTNYAVGSYLVHGGQLCKVTTAIATGESISIGTNVTATTVMAEVIALIAQ